jgi:hypothetical protein
MPVHHPWSTVAHQARPLGITRTLNHSGRVGPTELVIRFGWVEHTPRSSAWRSGKGRTNLGDPPQDAVSKMQQKCVKGWL